LDVFKEVAERMASGRFGIKVTKHIHSLHAQTQSVPLFTNLFVGPD